MFKRTRFRCHPYLPEAGFASVDIAMVSKHEGEELLDELLSRFNVTEKDFTWAWEQIFSGKGLAT